MSTAPAAGALKMSDEVATVNGDGITVREYVESLRRLRALHESITELRHAALEDCVQFKVTQQLAREHGVLADVSDAALRAEFTAENARRASAIVRQEIIYGPKRLTWEQFRATWLDRIQLKLGQALLARGGHALEQEPHAEIKAAERAVHAAVATAKVKPAEAVLAALEPNTPLPAP